MRIGSVGCQNKSLQILQDQLSAPICKTIHTVGHGVFYQILSPRARLHQSAEPDVLDLPAVAFPPDQQLFPFSGSG